MKSNLAQSESSTVGLLIISVKSCKIELCDVILLFKHEIPPISQPSWYEKTNISGFKRMSYGPISGGDLAYTI